MPPVANPPTLDQVVAAMVGLLNPFLPPPAPPLPNPAVLVASVKERPVGIGSRRGADSLGPFGAVDPKGVRVEAVVRFQLWATGAQQADSTFTSLNNQVLAARDSLFTQGFLQLALESAPPPDYFSPPLNQWRKYGEYRVLYEYTYIDSDGAASLIARIPIEIDSQLSQSMTVSDQMTRWDNLNAPALEVRGAALLGSLWMLAFIPGAPPTGSVTLERTFDGAAGPAANHPSLASFLAAVAGPNPSERHASVTFASFSGFQAASSAAGDPVFLGDWNLDGIPDSYSPLALSLAPAISLPNVTDRFLVTYQAPPFDQVGVAYLRAASGS